MKNTFISLELMSSLSANSAKCKVTINFIWIYKHLQHPSEQQEKQAKRQKKICKGLRQALSDNLMKLSD